MKEQANMTKECKQPEPRKAYSRPVLKQVGTLAELTQGYAGSLPDEQGGQTKRNPFTG